MNPTEITDVYLGAKVQVTDEKGDSFEGIIVKGDPDVYPEELGPYTFNYSVFEQGVAWGFLGSDVLTMLNV